MLPNHSSALQSFLHQTAQHLLAHHGHQLDRIGVVLPTRRAGLFLRKALAEVRAVAGEERPFWLPRTYTLAALLEETAGRIVPDRLTLLLTLYEEYHRLVPDEPLERFLSWGEIILLDVEHADAAQADAGQLFANLRDWKELEANLSFSAAELESFRAFWQTFSADPLGDLQQRFLRLWDVLGPLYRAYQQRLLEQDWAYPGLIARDIAKRLKTGAEVVLPVDHVVLAGLSDLSLAEMDVVAQLVKQGRATVLPDADAWYLDRIAQHEAGRWFRRSLSDVQRKDLPQQLGHQSLDLTLLGAPQQVAQAKSVADWIASQMAGGAKLDELAVVLPDETLLFPVLYALPPGLDEVNVTMGYPMRWAPLYSLLQGVLDLNQRARRDATQHIQAYYHRDVRQLLLHTHVQALAPDALRDYLWELERSGARFVVQNKLPHISQNPKLPEHLTEFLAVLFRPVERADDALAAFLEIIASLRDHLFAQDAERSTPVAVVELEVLFHFHTELLRLRDLLGGQLRDLSLNALWRLLSQVFASGRIPFSGEPLKGLQILGLGETRALDFRHVLILSCNEGILPQGKRLHSLVPFALRKAFRLPTYEDHDAETAYRFYRLLQRAESVTCTYDLTPKRDGGAGEPSRMLLQLQYELALSEQVQLHRQVLQLPVRVPVQGAIVVEKDAQVLAQLARFIGVDGQPPQRPLYPTDLQHYVACPLRFYLYRVAEVAVPEDEPADHMDARLLGSILHTTLFKLYKPLEGQTLQAEDVAALHAQLGDVLLQAAQAEMPDLQFGIQGRNLLLVNVLKRLATQVLELDQSLAPLTMRNLEHRLERSFVLPNGHTVTLAGRADRIDETQGQLRIVDYKTGKVDSKKADELALLFHDPVHKEAFQAALYAWLLDADGTALGNRRLSVALYAMRDLHKGSVDVFTKVPIGPTWGDYELHLERMLMAIFDPAVPFVQRKDEAICQYCDFYRNCYASANN